MANEYDDLIVTGKPPSGANEYYDMLNGDRHNQKSALKQSMYVASKKQPDRHADILKLSEKTEMPVDIVERNYDAIKQKDEVSGSDYDSLIDKTPSLAKFFEDPNNSSLGKDDVDNLSTIDISTNKIVKRGSKRNEAYDFPVDIGRAAKSGWNDLESTTAQMAGAFGLMDPAAAAKAAAAANKRSQEIKDKMPDYAKEFNSVMEKEGGDVSRAFNVFKGSFEQVREGNILNALKDFSKGGALTVGETIDMIAAASVRPRGLSYSVAQNLPYAIPSLAAGFAGGEAGAKIGAGVAAIGGQLGPQAATPEEIVTVPAGAVVGGAIGFASGTFAGSYFTEVGSWINQSLQQRGFDITSEDDLLRAYSDPKLMSEIRSEAERKGVTTAAVDSLFNMFAGKFLAKASGQGVVKQAVAGAKEVGVQSVGEVAGEFAGQAAAYKDLSKANLGESIQEGITSLGQSVGEAVVGKSFRAVLPAKTTDAAAKLADDTDKAFKARQDAQDLSDIGQAVKNSKLSKRLPDKIRELVSVATNDQEASSVFFQNDEWDSYWTKKGLSPAKAAEQILGDNGKAYHEAKETGAPLEIPLDKYVSAVGPTEDYEGLLPSTRTSPDGMSLQEAREHIANLPATMQELANEASGIQPEAEVTAAEESKSIAKNVEEQLVAAGVKPKDAKTQSKIYESAFKSLAERSGLTPKELFDRYGLKIQGAEQVAQAGNPGQIQLEQSQIQQSIQPNELGFVSKLEQTISEKMGGSQPVPALKAMLKDIKPEEMKWSGLDEYLKGKDKVSKAEVLEFLRANQLEIREVTLGGEKPVEMGAAVYQVFAPDGEGVEVYLDEDMAKKAADKLNKEAVAEVSEKIDRPHFAELIEWTQELAEANPDRGFEVGEEVWVVYGPNANTDDFFGRSKEKSAKALADEYNDDYVDENIGELGKYFVEPTEYDGQTLEDVETLEDGGTKFSQYTLPGGDNYREVLLTMPPQQKIPDGWRVEKSPDQEHAKKYPDMTYFVYDTDNKIAGMGVTESSAIADAIKVNPSDDKFKSSHFDETNILAHVRLNDRVDADGKKVLFVEEIQSDWHQAGRKKGYKEGDTLGRLKSLVKEYNELWSDKANRDSEQNKKRRQELAAEYNKIAEIDPVDTKSKVPKIGMNPTEDQLDGIARFADSGKVPDAPFKKTWHEFALKRIIRMAAEQGYDRVAWTTGEQQAERYDLSKQINSIRYSKDGDTYRLEVADKNDNIVMNRESDSAGLDDLIGKEVAERIRNGDGKKPKSGPDVRILSGLDLKVGGEGMKGFYDNILVKSADKMFKKFGVKVKDASVEAPIFGESVGDIKEWREHIAQLKEEKDELSKTKDLIFQETSSNDVFRKYEVEKHPKLIAEEALDDGKTFVQYDNRVVKEYTSIDEAMGNVEKDIQEYLENKINEETKNVIEAEANRKSGTKVHSLDITPELKQAAINEGFTLFQQGRGNIRFGSDRQFTINLLKNADFSTFLHESGHFYLEILGDLAEADGTNQQVKDDYAQVLNWLGVESRDQIKTEHHEKWARGFEAYLMEGKSPSSALTRAFNKFKIWLVSIYREARNLNVELSADIRKVFDRILATDEELNAAQAKYDPLFSDPTQQGMTDSQAARYLEAREEARISAETSLTNKVMQDYKREKESFYKSKRKEIKDQVTKEVNDTNLYKALSILQRGTMPDGSALPQGVEPIKLSREYLVQLYGADFVKNRLPRPFVYSRDGGIHPDVAAELFGFDSGDALITALANALPRNEMIDRLTDARMLEAFPETIEPHEMPEEAIKAIHNDKRAQLLRMELEHLASENMPVLKDVIRRVARRVPSEKLVRETAQRIIGERKVSELKPYIFERAEVKYANEAGKLLAKGDIDGAFEAKRKELLNHELYRAAVEAKETVNKSIKNLKRINKKSEEDLAKTRDIDLVNAARAVLSEFGLGITDKTIDDYLSKMAEYDPDGYRTIKALVDSATMVKGFYKDISYNDFVAMNDAVESLWSLSKTSREIEIDGVKLDTEKMKEELIARLEVAGGANFKPGYNKAVSKNDRVKMGLLGARSALRRVESWTDAVDGGRGAFTKYVFEPISEASTRYRIDKKAAIEKYLSLVKGVEKSLTQDDINAPELNYTFSGKQELMGALLHTGNESNLRKLLVGRNWGSVNPDGSLNKGTWNKFLNRMYQENVITKADMDFVQNIWDLLEQFKAPAQVAHKNMYGHYFNEITAEPVLTPFGTYRGGYMPAVADSFIAQDANIRNEKEALEKSNNSFMFPTAGRGFTKSRVESYAAPLAIDMALVPSHIDKVLKFVHIEPKVKSISKIVFDKGFRANLDQFDPTVAGDMLVPWLQRAAQQKISTPSQGRAGQALDAFFRELRTRTGFQIMTFNVVNTLQQFTGISIAAVKVKPKYLRNALWSYIRSPKKFSESIVDKSKFMNTRATTNVMELQGTIDDLLLNPTKYERARDFASKHGYFLQQHTQNIVDTIVWSGAYDQAIEDGASEVNAVREADAAIRKTQGSFNAEDISRFETGTPFMRAFTMFYSYFNMQANLLGTEFQKIARDLGLRKGAGRALYMYAFGFMLPAILSESLVRAFAGKGFDEDDDDQYMDDFMSIFFGSQFRSLTAMAPGVGQTIQAGINSFNDKWYDDRITTSPAISMIESAVKAPKSVYEAVVENGNQNKAIKDTLTAVGLFTGLPIAPLGRPISYGLDVSTGKAEPTGPIDFTRGLITGKPGQ